MKILVFAIFIFRLQLRLVGIARGIGNFTKIGVSALLALTYRAYCGSLDGKEC
jgi:hypothetical protein